MTKSVRGESVEGEGKGKISSGPGRKIISGYIII